MAELAQTTTEETDSVSAATEEQTVLVENVSDQIESLMTDTRDPASYLDGYEVQQTDLELDLAGRTSRASAVSDGGSPSDD